MRILHISTRLILGGSQENTILSCEGQARLHHEVHLAYGPIFGPEGSMMPRLESFNSRILSGPPPHNPIRTHLIPHLVRDLNPRADWNAYFELRRLIADLQPDIVHTHSSKAGILGRAAAWAEGGKRNKPRIIHTIHGPPFHRYEKPWRNRLYITLEKFAARRCHSIVSVADAMTAQFRQAGIGKPCQFITVRSGMEIEPFLDAGAPGETRHDIRATLGIQPDDIIIGTIARLAELKGHDDIIDALESDLLHNPRLKLLWVGDGWWTKRLTARLLRLNLRHKVIMTGLVPTERIPTLLHAMDLVVHASYREGLPRVVPQALLSAVPVVAYDVDGTREACIDHETGRLIPPGDITALREAIRWMLADPARAKSTAEKGRAFCIEHFSAQHMVDELERVYTAPRAASST